MLESSPENNLGARTRRRLVGNLRHGLLAVWILAAFAGLAAIGFVVWPFL